MWTETDCLVESIECVFCCGLLTQNSPYTHFQLAELSVFGEFNAFESYAMNHICIGCSFIYTQYFVINTELSSEVDDFAVFHFFVCLFVLLWFFNFLFLCSAVIRCISLEFQRISSIVVFQRIPSNKYKHFIQIWFVRDEI